MKNMLLALSVILTASFAISAQALPAVGSNEVTASNAMDELDPFSPDIEKQLEEMDQDYQQSTGTSPFMTDGILGLLAQGSGCYRLSCEVYIQVIKAEQTAYLYIHGRLQYTWPVSTGVSGHGTPDFDKHPNGRIYDAYTSSKYPGGDYNGLGNMPYAVFIEGGFAIHGTGQGNWRLLGQRASHGCIRLHPDNGKLFNRLVRQNGINNTWITVQ